MAEHPGNAGGIGGVGPGGGAGGRPGGGSDDGLASMSLGSLLRVEADGELTPAQAARLEGVSSSCACGPMSACRGACRPARVGFERALRSCCGRAMGRGEASAGLRARVSGMALGASGATGREAGSDSQAGSAVRHPASDRGGSDRPASGRAPAGRRRVAMLGGVVMLLVVLAGAVYQAILNTQTTSNSQTTFTAQLASFMTTEHERTAGPTAPARAKFTCREASRVCQEFKDLLGESPVLPALEGAGNVTFEGAARCGVPGGPSIHARFYVVDAPDGQRHEVSLFIQRDTGRLDLDEGIVYRMDCPRRAACVWRRGGLIYYSVADDAVGCASLRSAAGVGEPVGVVRSK